MNKTDVRLAKAAILKFLTENATFGDGRKSLAIFDADEGNALYNNTDLSMVMDKVVLGLYLALNESEKELK